ncbi:hypothetical protein AC482_00980 [miscellaneous Crenarchaeota group-15 archaeon DG-45]|uniref:Prephenate/arogenate dehydrogenase domain-containing protein n=1 Tax=miscellaneous Crenarchaeota group-15 archaeon DG-45 TaxID=1685127 RepID=A0A0M0BSD9_9ARCH|nr:MAG: hypothetical protein AC482_00980 [miscellaneous Crenarchaeota group-15 archaeon DG-45]
MGAWFARYFSSRGFPTAITDVRGEEAREVASAVGAELKGTNIGAAGDADLVLISVPIPSVGKVVSEVAPHMREGAVLAEVSSVKETTVRALREAAAFGVKPLSIHPLFGPAAESLKGKTIVVVPVIDGDAEAGLAERLFEGAEIVVSEQEEHDRAMAVVLGLTHFMNLAFARVLSEADIASLKRLAGTTFTVQLAVAEAVVSEEPGLVASLLRENRHTSEYLDRFTAAAEMLRNLMTEGPEAFEGLYESLRASLGEDPDYHKADERRYRAFEALMD